MVLIRVRGQRGEDGRGHVRHFPREQGLVAQIVQCLVGVVVQELLDVLGPADRVVERLGVGHLVVVELVQQLVRVRLELLLTLRGLLQQTTLVLVADVIPVHGLVANDQPDQVRGVGQLGVRGEVHGQVEPGVEQEGLQQGGGHLLFQRVVTLVVRQHDVGLALQVLVLARPAERLVDLLHGRQRGEDGRVGLRMHGFHERDVRVHGFLVQGLGVRDQGDRAHGALDGVQQGQAREHLHGEVLLLGRERLPRLDVIGQRDLLGEPEIGRQTVPDFGVLLVLDAIPVDGLRRVAEQFDLLGGHGAHWLLRGWGFPPRWMTPTALGGRALHTGSRGVGWRAGRLPRVLHFRRERTGPDSFHPGPIASCSLRVNPVSGSFRM